MIQQKRLKWRYDVHQSFSSLAFIAHPSLTFYLKCVKTKNKFVVVFAHSNWRHLGWAQQSCRRSRSLCLSSATKIFVGTETRSENNIGFSSLGPWCTLPAGPGRVHIKWSNFLELLKIFMGMQVAVNNDLTISICFQTNNNCLHNHSDFLFPWECWAWYLLWRMGLTLL